MQRPEEDLAAILEASIPKAPDLSRQAKKLEYQDNCDRNAVEGLFGTVKTAYGLDRVMGRLQETAVCVIGAALLRSNLSLSLRAALALFCRGCRAEPNKLLVLFAKLFPVSMINPIVQWMVKVRTEFA